MDEMQIVARHTASAPVRIHDLFDELGVAFREAPTRNGESGWIEKVGERFKVLVNANEPEPRRRFTAAHELAHYLLHRDLLSDGDKGFRHIDHLYGEPVDNPASPFKRRHEVQANRMAAQIIMPSGLVREYHKQGWDTAKLASEFGVSRQAMDIRLETLGLNAP